MFINRPGFDAFMRLTTAQYSTHEIAPHEYAERLQALATLVARGGTENDYLSIYMRRARWWFFSDKPAVRSDHLDTGSAEDFVVRTAHPDTDSQPQPLRAAADTTSSTTDPGDGWDGRLELVQRVGKASWEFHLLDAHPKPSVPHGHA